jgi:sugar-specific transcriptional regulator TrmB
MNLTVEMKKNLYASLKQLDLNDQEAQLYLLSLNLGPTLISNLAKHLKMARPNVYLLIKKLEQAGLVKKYKNKFDRRFFVEPPTVVLESVRKQKQSLNANEFSLVADMPDLLALYSQGSRKTNIKILDGQEQFDSTYKKILEEAGDRVEFFGSFGDYLKHRGWLTPEKFIKERIKRKIKVNALFFPFEKMEQTIKKDKNEFRESRILKEAAPFITSFQIFANKVIIWQPKAPLAVLIEDEFIVQMFRSIFYKLWNDAK